MSLYSIAGALGEGGVAQVYVDAGRPIDTAQVKRLLRECLAEKIRTMLGTRETLDRTPGDVTRPTDQSAQRSDAAVQSDAVYGRAMVEQTTDPLPARVSLFIIILNIHF